MARYLPFQDELDDIEEQGIRLRRRQDKMRADIAFLADSLLTNPTADMQAHRRLLLEWEEEIQQLERSLAYLRERYKELKQQQYVELQKRQMR